MMENQPTLIVLAAGMGSRYGGLKQLDPMGPHGETLLDYSVFDAVRSGFQKVVFVIRKDIEEAFQKTVGLRYENRVELAYAFQQLEDLPNGYSVPDGRSKPWGTAHALRAARDQVTGPMAVINADDYYGADAFAVLIEHFRSCATSGRDPLSLVGYSLSQTLSDHGTVNRGLCQVRDGLLLSVEEVTDIGRDREGTILGSRGDGSEIRLDPDAQVSMNCWGFAPSIFEQLEACFLHFLKYECHGLTAEFYIPSFVDKLIRDEGAKCQALQTSARWFGVTYPGDKPFVQDHVRKLIARGHYPSPLLD